MKTGTRLYTKDGRKIGNGIILSIAGFHPELGNIYKIKTDFGNVVRFTEEEITSLFWTSNENYFPEYPDNVESWMMGKIKLLFKGVL